MILHSRVLTIFLLFYTVHGVPYPTKMCSTADCSLQLNPFRNGSCAIHNTSVCQHFWSNFTKSPEVRLKYEEEAKFSVAVTPYVAEIYTSSLTIRLPAINVTFSVHEEGVSALAVKIIKSNNTICRLIDFQGFESSFTIPTNVFYECFYNMNEYQNIRLDVVALPANELLSYYTYVPPAPHTYPINDICDWKPVIMVFCGRLASGVVIVKFSQAPQRFYVSHYSVELISNTSTQLSTKTVPSDNSAEMLSAKFMSVDSGYYSVIVRQFGNGSSCHGTEFGTFQVEYSKPGPYEVVAICIILFFTSCCLVLYKFRNKSMLLNAKKALFLASHDCLAHKDFIAALVNYLTKKFHLKINIIYGELGKGLDPHSYTRKIYLESDIIIFLISEGLLITLDNNDHRRLKVFHPWKDQLQKVADYIFRIRSENRKEFSKKKVCRLVFPYAKYLNIPEQLRLETGKGFTLPERMNDFLNYVYDSHPTINCMLPILCEDLESSEEGQKLLQKMRLVEEKVRKEQHLEFEPNEEPRIDNFERNSDTSSCLTTDEGVSHVSSSEISVDVSLELLPEMSISDAIPSNTDNSEDSDDTSRRFSHVSESSEEAMANAEFPLLCQNSDDSLASLDEETLQYLLRVQSEMTR